ncbi:MAG: hypothetical protein RJA66_424, partial [Actinomycetota bacterium]
TDTVNQADRWPVAYAGEVSAVQI